MNTPYDLNADVGRMVYVKPIAVDNLPKEVRDQAVTVAVAETEDEAAAGEQEKEEEKGARPGRRAGPALCRA